MSNTDNQAPKTEALQYQGAIHLRQKELMNRWAEELQVAAQNNAPTAYSPMPGGNLQCLLRCLGMYHIFPEINSLRLSIRHKSLHYLEVSEEKGYATDLCGYAKADLGVLLSGDESPLGTKLPKPTFLLCVHSGCSVYIKWWEQLAEHTGAPLYVVDVPFVRVGGEPRSQDIDYVVRQLKEVIQICENMTGKKLDYDQLRESLVLAREMEQTWSKIVELVRNIPSPYDVLFDGTTLMGILNTWRGTQEGVDFLHAALADLQEKVRLGMGPLPEEKFRIVIEGTPPFPYFKTFRDLFAKWGATIVGCIYTKQPPGFAHDPDRPLESMAEYSLRMFINQSLLNRYEMLKEYIKENSADGLVIHSIKSCRLFSTGHGDMRRYFSTVLGVPTVMLESDVADPRYFSVAQLRNRIDAFFEVLHREKYVSASAAKSP